MLNLFNLNILLIELAETNSTNKEIKDKYTLLLKNFILILLLLFKKF
jgi:hypothetical protein